MPDKPLYHLEDLLKAFQKNKILTKEEMLSLLGCSVMTAWRLLDRHGYFTSYNYNSQLTGHVIDLPGRREPFVVQRINNPAEHLFGATKRGVRRKLGTKQLSRQFQAMRAECLLVRNLTDYEYLEVVLDGNLENLPAAIMRHWPLAQMIRQERTVSTSGHPMPTTKKQLRAPELLPNIEQTINQIAETIISKTKAA